MMKFEEPISWRLNKGLDPATQQRLEARGVIEARLQKEFPDRIQTYEFTAGLEAARSIAVFPAGMQ